MDGARRRPWSADRVLGEVFASLPGPGCASAATTFRQI